MRNDERQGPGTREREDLMGLPTRKTRADLFTKKEVLERVQISADTGCWVWTGSKDTGGYAQFCRQGITQRMHRVAYALWKNDPGELHALHKCDNPACVNPNHIVLGTHYDNMIDKVRKGRVPRGVRCQLSKLNPVVVNVMRWMRFVRGFQYKRIANAYGVTDSTVRAICIGFTWKHVPFHPRVVEAMSPEERKAYVPK